MNNSKIILIGAVIIVFVVGGFYFKKHSKKTVTESPVVNENNTPTESQVENTKKEDSTICNSFPKEEIASITGLNITSTKVLKMGEDMENTNCGYYIDGRNVASALTIGLYKGDVSKAKEKYQNPVVFKGWRVLTDSEITMNHFITYNEVQQLSDIYLIKGPNEFYRISLFSLTVLKSGQMIKLANQIASKIK